MKKLTLLISAAIVICTTSCKKLVDAVFQGEDFTLSKVSLTIPAIPFADSTHEFEAGSFTTYLNVDSAIRAHTGGVFGIGVVDYIKVKQVVITAHNTDAFNNLSAFKSFRLTISSNSKSAVSDMLLVNFPADAVSTYTETPDNSPNIVDYMHGTSFTNTAYGSARKTTTHSMTIDMVITLTAR